MMRKNFQDFTIYQSIIHIDRILWNGLNNEAKTCLSYSYLTALEQAPPSGMHFRYAVVYKNSNPAGIAVFQLLPPWANGNKR